MSLLKRLWLGLSGSANKRQVFDMALNCMLAGGVGAARGTHWLETEDALSYAGLRAPFFELRGEHIRQVATGSVYDQVTLGLTAFETRHARLRRVTSDLQCQLHIAFAKACQRRRKKRLCSAVAPVRGIPIEPPSCTHDT